MTDNYTEEMLAALTCYGAAILQASEEMARWDRKAQNLWLEVAADYRALLTKLKEEETQ